jgi:DNA-binding LacI/PurR family transcriptional regulator
LSFGHLDRILVVGGPWKKIRQLSFKKEIRRKQPHCDVTIRECEAFDKEIAEREVLRELSAAIRNGQMYDAIFCVTDSLTIGCIEAISQISWGQIKQPKVIGYDGTPAVKQMILDNRTSLQGVIVQNAEEVANLAVLTLMDLQGPKRRERIAAVAPSVFPKYLLK